MIPGLEYEQEPEHQPPQPATTTTHSASSVQSVDISPRDGTHDRHHPLAQLHRRRPHNFGANTHGQASYHSAGAADDDNKYTKRTTTAKAGRKLDFFPKMERDYTVKTERGGQFTLVGYGIMIVLMMAEFLTWRRLNQESLEHIVVDTR